MAVLGTPLPRVDGALKVSGGASYAADVKLPNLAFGVLLCSTIPKGRIASIDTRLASAQPGAVETLAVEKFGAAGIVSYAMNQRTAWWGEDENLVRWGHLQSFPAIKTFAFMVSLKTAAPCATAWPTAKRSVFTPWSTPDSIRETTRS